MRAPAANIQAPRTAGFCMVPDNLSRYLERLGGGLGLLEWVLMVNIWRLQSRGLPCYLTNQHFATATATNERTVTRAITKLQARGLISSKVNQKKTRLISPRLLILTDVAVRVVDDALSPIDKMSTGDNDLWTECLPPIDKMSTPPIDKMSTNQSIYNQTITRHINTPASPTCGAEKSFDTFWTSYPKKKGKKDAQKAFTKVNPNEYPALFSALEQQKKDPEWAKDGGQYIPYPATWLNGRRWEDEVEVCTEAKSRTKERVICDVVSAIDLVRDPANPDKWILRSELEGRA